MVPETAGSVSEADRHAIVVLLRQAVARDVVPFGEVDGRFEAVYRATTRAELDAVIADLPPPPPPAPPAPVPRSHPISATSYTMFGDLNVGGSVAVEGDLRYGAGFGDIVIDLSGARLPRDLTISARSVFGDITVIVPDGVTANLESVTVFGDRNCRLAPAIAGAPTVRVLAYTLFGDAKVYSVSHLPVGRLRRVFQTLRILPKRRPDAR